MIEKLQLFYAQSMENQVCKAVHKCFLEGFLEALMEISFSELIF